MTVFDSWVRKEVTFRHEFLVWVMVDEGTIAPLRSCWNLPGVLPPGRNGVLNADVLAPRTAEEDKQPGGIS